MAGMGHSSDGLNNVDVLIVGAGPTGLALAAQLQSFGIGVRIIDRALEPAGESRALALQARTLEALAPLAVTGPMVRAGNRSAQLRVHFGDRTTYMGLFDIGAEDTSYPYLLFLSQAETERILTRHLARQHNRIRVDRGFELQDLEMDEFGVDARIRHISGAIEHFRASYVVGCDGAHSSVRRKTPIEFTGSTYRRSFVLADLDADGLEKKAVHAFPGADGVLFFFPLGGTTQWRMIGMRPPGDSGKDLSRQSLQELADPFTQGRVRLHEPVWATNFKLHHGTADSYAEGRIFLAGDAAHVHSPVGAQGMNTGIQDALNLGWKLALAVSHGGNRRLLDSYAEERMPVGAAVVSSTDRVFRIAISGGPLARLVRTRLLPLLLPLLLRLVPLRRAVLRAVSELGISYRSSPIAVTGPGGSRRGPRPGDRLPDASVIRDGQVATLHEQLTAPGFHLLLCGDGWTGTGPASTTAAAATAAGARAAGWQPLAGHPLAALVTVHRIGGRRARSSGALQLTADRDAAKRLGLNGHSAEAILVRPDGYIGYRGAGTGLEGVRGYLDMLIAGPKPVEPDVDLLGDSPAVPPAPLWAATEHG